MHVVVTGGAGFIGTHLVEALLERGGCTVLVLDNLHRGRSDTVARYEGDERVRFLRGDVRDAAMVERALDDADLVYHLAAQSNVLGAVSDPRYSFETNVAGTFNVLEAARQGRARRVVFASSREAYGEVERLPVPETHPLTAKNTYGASKVAGEAYCRSFATVFGLETAVLRFSNVYGTGDRDRVIPLWIDRAVRHEPIEVFGGRQVIDFIWVGYAVEALLRAAEAGIAGTPINVGSGSGTPILDLADRIIALAGSRSEVRIVPSRPAEVTQFVADVSAMRERLDLSPDPDPLAHLPQLLPVAVR
jgi:UDP-glucose 4-epimerase